MSRTSRINELLDAFGDQSEIIRKQNDIIDRLFTLLSMHLSSEELADLDEEIKEVKASSEGGQHGHI